MGLGPVFGLALCLPLLSVVVVWAEACCAGVVPIQAEPRYSRPLECVYVVNLAEDNQCHPFKPIWVWTDSEVRLGRFEQFSGFAAQRLPPVESVGGDHAGLQDCGAIDRGRRPGAWVIRNRPIELASNKWVRSDKCADSHVKCWRATSVHYGEISPSARAWAKWRKLATFKPDPSSGLFLPSLALSPHRIAGGLGRQFVCRKHPILSYLASSVLGLFRCSGFTSKAIRFSGFSGCGPRLGGGLPRLFECAFGLLPLKDKKHNADNRGDGHQPIEHQADVVGPSPFVDAWAFVLVALFTVVGVAVSALGWYFLVTGRPWLCAVAQVAMIGVALIGVHWLVRAWGQP